LRVVFMGTPEFAVPSLERLILNEYQVVAVYTPPDKVAGRGRSLGASPVKRAALSRELTVVQPDGFKEGGEVARLSDFNPDVIVVAAFGQILPQAVLDLPPCGCINIHPSLLPEFRGLNTHQRAIDKGIREHGASVHFVTEELDGGPVIVQVRIPVLPGDDAASLSARVLKQEHSLYALAIRWLAEGRVRWEGEQLLFDGQPMQHPRQMDAID